MSPPSSATPGAALSFLHQPRAVWATAFACVVGFMSIGLVDPILTSIAAGLHATPSQVSLLFTSYFAVTALMMLITGFVSSRIGGRATLLVGTLLVAIFAALSGTSQSVAELVAFRGGWGLGNSLFVATSLSVIVGVANGGVTAAILMYEAALGVGLSMGPLLGAALGTLSWRYPFFGTAALMAIGFIAIALFLPKQPKPQTKVGFSDPLRALSHRGLAVTAVSAFFYNYAFFTVLAFVPFVLHASAYVIGGIFFGWGLLLAIFSVVVAPRLQARLSALNIVAASLVLLAAMLVVMAFGPPWLIAAAVVVSGAAMGLNNTVYTEIALEVSPAPRPVASAGYNFVRWFAGVIAPYAAPEIAEYFGVQYTFLLAALAALAAVAVLMVMRGALGRYGAARPAASEPAAHATTTAKPILVAIDGTEADSALLAHALKLAKADGTPIQLLHVTPIEMLDGEAAASESDAHAKTAAQRALHQLASSGVLAKADVVTASGARTAQAIIEHADRINAAVIVLGTRHRHDLDDIIHGSVADTMAAAGANRPVIFVSPDPQTAG